MRDILFSGTGASSEWMSESRSQYCTYMTMPVAVAAAQQAAAQQAAAQQAAAQQAAAQQAAAQQAAAQQAAAAAQPAMASTPFGLATVVPQALPPRHATLNNWMYPHPPAESVYYVPQQPMFVQPPPPAGQANLPASVVPADVTDAAADGAEEARAAEAAIASKDRSKSPGARRAPEKAPKHGKRPPFHTYGRANTKPTAGGFMYGDYLATHNTAAGKSIPRSRRPSAKEMGGAQVHYMEHDMRESHSHSAHYTPPRFEEPSPAPADAEDRHRVEAAKAAQAKPPVGCDPVGWHAAFAERSSSAPPAAAAEPAHSHLASAAASAEQVYASRLPAYDPSAYCLAMPQASAPYLPYYPMPLTDDHGTHAEGAMLSAAVPAAPYYSSYAAAPPPQPPPSAQLAAFVPDELGARLDPRRFKFAPRFAMASVMPAGLRSVRRDNLAA